MISNNDNYNNNTKKESYAWRKRRRRNASRGGSRAPEDPADKVLIGEGIAGGAVDVVVAVAVPGLATATATPSRRRLGQTRKTVPVPAPAPASNQAQAQNRPRTRGSTQQEQQQQQQLLQQSQRIQQQLPQVSITLVNNNDNDNDNDIDGGGGGGCGGCSGSEDELEIAPAELARKQPDLNHGPSPTVVKKAALLLVPAPRNFMNNLPYMGELTFDSRPRRGRKPKKADICHLITKNYGIQFPTVVGPSIGARPTDKAGLKRSPPGKLLPPPAPPFIVLPKSGSSSSKRSKGQYSCPPPDLLPIALLQERYGSHTPTRNLYSSPLISSLSRCSAPSAAGTGAGPASASPSPTPSLTTLQKLYQEKFSSFLLPSRCMPGDSAQPLNLCTRDVGVEDVEEYTGCMNSDDSNPQGGPLSDSDEMTIEPVDDDFTEDETHHFLHAADRAADADKAVPEVQATAENYGRTRISGKKVAKEQPPPHNGSSSRRRRRREKASNIPAPPPPPQQQPQQWTYHHHHLLAASPPASCPAKTRTGPKKKNGAQPRARPLVGPGAISPDLNSAVSAAVAASNNAQVSICKFKFTGGVRPSLQEKKMLSLDSGGNFRFYSDKPLCGSGGASDGAGGGQVQTPYQLSGSGGKKPSTFGGSSVGRGGSQSGRTDVFCSNSSVNSSGGNVTTTNSLLSLPKSAKSMSMCMLPTGTGSAGHGHLVPPEPGPAPAPLPNITITTCGRSSRQSSRSRSRSRSNSTSGASCTSGRSSYYSSSEAEAEAEASESKSGCPAPPPPKRLEIRSARSSAAARRRTKKSMMRENLEKTFKEKGFLIQTQQLESSEGVTYCKFRQLKKFTRYLFRSWKDYLPEAVKDSVNSPNGPGSGEMSSSGPSPSPSPIGARIKKDSKPEFASVCDDGEESEDRK